MSESAGGFSREEWEGKLALLGQELAQQESTASITVVGSAPGILAGQPGRTSMDLDVWRPTSDYDRRTFQTAVEAAGLLFDPRGGEPAGAYIQLVEPGIVQMGKFEPELVDCRSSGHRLRTSSLASFCGLAQRTCLMSPGWWLPTNLLQPTFDESSPRFRLSSASGRRRTSSICR